MVPRIRLKPQIPPQSGYDGCWWPRSRDLERELPSLLEGISHRLPDVALVGYSVGAWDVAPPQLQTTTGSIVLNAFTAHGTDTVVAISHLGHTVSLEIIPTATGSEDARRLMSRFCETDARRVLPASNAEKRTEGSLDEVAHRLITRFAYHQLSAAEITSWVDEAAENLAAAPIQAFVPVLVEHIVRARIIARQTPVPLVASTGAGR